MALNNYFQVSTNNKRPKAKLWLCKPNFSRIDRLGEITNLNGSFKFNNMNQLSFTVPTQVFNEETFQPERNSLLDIIRNKYVIEFEYIDFKDYLIIEDIKKISSDSDRLELVAHSISTELNKKSVNELEMLASTIEHTMSEVFKSYAPLWSVSYVDPKLADVKREITAQQSTITAVIDQINTLFDSVVIFDNFNRTLSFYHNDNAGVNRGLTIRENSYLKSFEDSLVSTDVITRLYPVGKEGMTIHSVNPAGTDYIEDFSYFIKPFKRDENKKVLQHSNYMSDELCHALLDYQEFYNSQVQIKEELNAKYKAALESYSQEDYKLTEYKAIAERLEDRVELLRPKNEYRELGYVTGNFELKLEKSSYYVLMIKNEGSLARVKVGGEHFDVAANDWTYIKIKAQAFQDATKYKNKAVVPVEIVAARTNLNVSLMRGSKEDHEEMDDFSKLEKKYNYIKYRELRDAQLPLVKGAKKKLDELNQQRASITNSLRPENFMSPELYKERELYVLSGVWQEENHTVEKELYEDAVKQLGKNSNSSRAVNIGIVNFTQSLEHAEDWDKLVAGEVLRFSNKAFDEKLRAYITDLSIDFDSNQITLSVSDVFDYKGINQKVSEALAQATSSATQINFQKEQIKNAHNRIEKIFDIIDGSIDARRQVITAGGQTIILNGKGLVNQEKLHESNYIIQNNGVISATRDNGTSHTVLADTKGLKAEAVTGELTLNNDTRIRNEDGTVYMDDEGLYVRKDKFHLVDQDGIDVLESIRQEQKEKISELTKVYDQKINTLVAESQDVIKTIDDTTTSLTEAFEDSFITEVEKRRIEENLATLEKENKDYVQKIELALAHPYISDEDLVLLQQEYESYQSIYETLVSDINESISDRKITEKESQLVSEGIKNFREEVQEILLIVSRVMETTRNNQIDSKVAKVTSFATRLSEDLHDEISDLEDAFKGLNKTVEESIQDGIFDAAEIENIKNNLFILTSENRDITNRHESVSTNPNLPAKDKAEIVKVYTAYNKAFQTFTAQVKSMMEDKVASEEEIQAYKRNFEAMTKARKEYVTAYDNALLIIAKAFSEDAKSAALGQLTAFKEEYSQDLKDLEQSIGDYKETIIKSFSDGIITGTEKGRLKTHQDIIKREKADLLKNYEDLFNNPLLSQQSKQDITLKKKLFDSAFNNLNAVIDKVISDSKITSEENNEAISALNSYETAFANYSTSIQQAINSLSGSIASKVVNESVNKFNSVLANIQNNIGTLQKQVDGAIDTWYYNYTPTLSNYPASEWKTKETKDAHIGDFFLNNKTGEAYRFTLVKTTYSWQILTDQAIVDALNKAKDAQDTADGKRRVFVDTPKPPYDIGDMWVQGDKGDFLVASVAKKDGQVYSAADWRIATRYTDDTLAKTALSKANEVSKSLTDFSKEIHEDFRDGIITDAEMIRLKTHLETIEVKYNDLKSNVDNVLKSAELDATFKKSLTEKNLAYNTRYTELKNSITASISDKKITPQEQLNASTYLQQYSKALADLTVELQKAVKNISINVAIQKAKDAVDNLEIGGRNLIEGSAKLNKSLEQTWGGYSQLHQVNITSANSKLSLGDIVTLSFDVQMTTGTYLTIYDNNGQIDFTLGARTWMNLGSQKQRLTYTAEIKKPTRKTGAVWTLSFYNNNNGDKFTIDNIQLEKGNKATAYSQAPEDVYAEIANSTKNFNEYKKYIETTFKDGVLTDSEYVRLKTISDEIDKDMLDLSTNIKDLSANVKLSSELKATLTSLENIYNTAHNTLQSNMATVIADKKITTQENTLVKNGLTAYNTALSNINTHIQKCLNDIADNIAKSRSAEAVDQIEIGGRNLLLNSQSLRFLQRAGASNSVLSYLGKTNVQKIVNGQGATYLEPAEDISIGKLEQGEFYTLSFSVCASGKNIPHTIRAYLSTASGGYKETTGKIESGKFNRVHTVFKATSSVPTRIHLNLEGFEEVYLTEFKLEKGNKATDYTPAPEDLIDEISKMEKSVIKKSEEIAKAKSDLAAVSAKSYSDGIVSKLEQSQIDYTNEKISLMEAEQKALETRIRAYADGVISKEEQARIDADAAKVLEQKKALELAETRVKAYADGKVTKEEQARIKQAEENLAAAKKHTIDAISKIEIGGRNLLLNSDKEYTNSSKTQRAEFVVIDDKNLSELFDKHGVGIYTFSFDLKSADTSKSSKVSIYPYPSEQPINEYTFSYQTFNITKEYKRYSFTCNVEHKNPTLSKTLMVLYGNYDTGNIPFIRNIKIEKGSHATDYTLAPEDTNLLIQKVQKEATDISKAITNYEGVIGATFKDNIITASEAKGLAQQKMNLEKEKAGITAKFNEVHNNKLLVGTYKSNLATAKAEYDKSHTTLLSAIDTAVANHKTTALEFSTVSQKFNDYKDKLAALTTRFEQAIDSLSTTKANNAASQYNTVITEINNKYDEVKAQADASINSYFYPYAPTLTNVPASQWASVKQKDAHVGDYFLDTSKGSYYTFSKVEATYTWLKGSDTAIQTALDTASKAQGTADKKKTVFTTQPVTPYDIGDMWTQGSGGDLYVCKVARASGNFVNADWEKATKYTDDTKAIEAFNVANKAIKDLSSFWDSANGMFKDGIIDSNELPRLKGHLDTLNNDKLSLTSNVTDISGNAKLDASMKATLTNLQTAYNNAHKALYDALNNAVKDKKVTDKEIADVSSKFSAYGTALSNLTTHVQKCYTNIADNVAISRSSEAVNALEIGGRNLVLNSNKNVTSSTYLVDRYELSEDWTTEEYTVTVWGTVNSNSQKLGLWSDNGSAHLAYLTPNATRNVWTTTFKGKISNADSIYPKRTLSLYNFPQATAGDCKITKIKLEKGNKATDWTPAPEDVDSQIASITKEAADVKKAVSGLQNTINNGFADGIITQSEAKAINQSKLKLVAEKKDLQAQYNNIVNNGMIADTKVKQSLIDAKVDYDKAYTTLTSYIDTAIKDGKATPQESANVTQYFAVYGDKIGVLSEKLTLAVEQINLARVENIRVGGKNILKNSDFSSKGKSWGINGTATFETIDGYSVAKVTNLTNQGIYQVITPAVKPDYYVLSFKAKAVGTTSRLQVGLLGQPTGHSNVFNIDNQWKTYSYAFTQPVDMKTNNSFHIYSTTASQQGFYITEVQLELGNKPTDWTPAQADIDEKTTAEITTATSNATNAWTKKLTTELGALKNPDSFPSSAIKVEALLADKLMSQALLGDKLVANNAFVSKLMANSIVTQKMQTTDLDAARIKSGSLNISSTGLKSSSGQTTIANNTITMTSTDKKNQIILDANKGMTIKKDGVLKVIDGLDKGTQQIFAYQPRFASYTKSKHPQDGTPILHVVDNSKDTAVTNYYSMSWAAKLQGDKDGSLIGIDKNCGRINRFTFYHEKRYLKINLSAYANEVNLYFHVDIPEEKSLHVEKIANTSNKTVFPRMVVDLGTPTYSDMYIEVSLGLTKTAKTAAYHSGGCRITKMQLSDYK